MMYAVKPIYDLDAEVDIPTCMYSMPVMQCSKPIAGIGEATVGLFTSLAFLHLQIQATSPVSLEDLKAEEDKETDQVKDIQAGLDDDLMEIKKRLEAISAKATQKIFSFLQKDPSKNSKAKLKKKLSVMKRKMISQTKLEDIINLMETDLDKILQFIDQVMQHDMRHEESLPIGQAEDPVDVKTSTVTFLQLD